MRSQCENELLLAAIAVDKNVGAIDVIMNGDNAVKNAHGQRCVRRGIKLEVKGYKGMKRSSYDLH